MLQGVLTALLLPPLLLVLVALAAGLAAWRGRRTAGVLAALCAAAVLVLGTPGVARLLTWSLEREVAVAAAPGAVAPAAIVILGAEMARSQDGPEVGPLTLERLRAGAALHRRTGLPVLVTAGPVAPNAPPLADLMARSLQQDFGITPRWIERQSRDTHENATLSVERLRADGLGAAFVVTHGWHLPRALEAFGRTGFPAVAAPVRVSVPQRWQPTDWFPRPDYLAVSWFMLREWAGRLVYAIRDGR